MRFLKSGCYHVEGFVPGGFDKDVVTLNQRSGEAVGVVDKVIAKAPFHAELPFIDGII